jgi:hypothetical protein
VEEPIDGTVARQRRKPILAAWRSKTSIRQARKWATRCYNAHRWDHGAVPGPDQTEIVKLAMIATNEIDTVNQKFAIVQ